MPFLIVHGAGDRQIPVSYAHRSYEQAVNSPLAGTADLPAAEGGAGHTGLDCLPHVSSFIVSRAAAAFAEMD